MDGWKLLALASWLSIPALVWAQSDAPRLADAADRQLILPPAYLSTPVAQDEPIGPVPNQAPKDVKPDSEPIEPIIPIPKKVDGKTDKKEPDKKPPAEIVPPKKVETPPAATIGQPSGTNYGLLDQNPPARLAWVTPEYLLWKTSGARVPALATSSPQRTPAANSGVPGEPGTSILFGNQTMLNGFRSGIRVRAGFWFDDTETLGIDGTFLFLGQAGQKLVANSTGSPGLSRPFFDVVNGVPSAEPIALGTVANGTFNSALAGNLFAKVATNTWGGDISFRRFLYENDSFRIDGLLGYRYQRLSDSIATVSNSTVNDDVNEPFILPNGSTLAITDGFNTTNNFNGGLLGISGSWQYGRWFVNANAKIALGATNHIVNINGSTTITSPGLIPATLTGGLLALPTNIGTYTSSAFSVIPEFGLNVGYQLTTNLRLFGGYSFMYWSDVVRAGDQIDTSLNTSQIPRAVPPSPVSGTPRPAFIMHDTGFFAQGANIGMELRW
jgi:hypothetical protein